MFTGIIQTRGEVVGLDPVGGDVRITVSAPEYLESDINVGDSIAVNGCCLTVIERQDDQLSFDVSTESMSLTLIGQWQLGTQVNLELALLPTTRMGGHMVSGHVDGLATLTTLEQDARSWRMAFEVPQNLSKYIVKKGSITIDGISLTVNNVINNKSENIFDINVIPHTLKVTTLGKLQVGDQVHIEVDLIARYLEGLLQGEGSADTQIAALNDNSTKK